MRLALVTNGLGFGGAERIVEALAKDAAARGDQVLVVATTRDGPIGAALRSEGVRVEVLGIRSPLDARIPLYLAQLARRFDAELLHSHLAVADIASAAAAALLRCPWVATAHNPGVELSRGKRSLWHLALRRADRVLAVSGAVRAALPPALGAQVLYPSLIGAGEPLLSREEARRRLGVPQDAPLVLGIGRLARVKGFDLLAEAARRLEARAARVLVIGEGPERGALERAGGLELVGAREDAGLLVSAADVLACPSRSEGFPQVPLHAFAAGVPVVATAVGGTAELVVEGISGRLVPPEDPAALTAALDALLADPALGRSLGGGGRRALVERGLTKEAMIAATRAVWAEVTARRSSAR